MNKTKRLTITVLSVFFCLIVFSFGTETVFAEQSQKNINEERIERISQEFTEKFIEAEENKNTLKDSYSLSGFATKRICVYNKNNREIIYGQNSQTMTYPASTTKILTAAVAAKYASEDMVFTVGKEITLIAGDSSIAGLVQGQKLTFRDILAALLLPSGNDSAYVIAANIGRVYANDETLSSKEAVDIFMELMNETAQRLGMNNSHFTCPDGYHDNDHYVTAEDMIKASVYAQTFPIVKEISSTYRYHTNFVTGESYLWFNSNPLLNKNGSYYCEYVNGLKTGFTDQAGSCIVISAEKDDDDILIAFLKSPDLYVRNREILSIIDKIY